MDLDRFYEPAGGRHQRRHRLRQYHSLLPHHRLTQFFKNVDGRLCHDGGGWVLVRFNYFVTAAFFVPGTVRPRDAVCRAMVGRPT